MTPNDKIQDLQEKLGHEPKRVGFMINLTELWYKIKKWRKGKDEKVSDSVSDSINDAIDRSKSVSYTHLTLPTNREV